MKIKQRKGIDKKLDTTWSKLVKLKAGMQCEYCKAQNKQLHSHHIYSNHPQYQTTCNQIYPAQYNER